MGVPSTVMTDDPFDRTRRPLLPPRFVSRREPLWMVRRGTAPAFSCDLVYRGEWGIEAEIHRDGVLLIGRRFDSRALAVRWAEGERRTLES